MYLHYAISSGAIRVSPCKIPRFNTFPHDNRFSDFNAFNVSCPSMKPWSWLRRAAFLRPKNRSYLYMYAWRSVLSQQPAKTGRLLRQHSLINLSFNDCHAGRRTSLKFQGYYSLLPFRFDQCDIISTFRSHQSMAMHAASRYFLIVLGIVVSCLALYQSYCPYLLIDILALHPKLHSRRIRPCPIRPQPKVYSLFTPYRRRCQLLSWTTFNSSSRGEWDTSHPRQRHLCHPSQKLWGRGSC